MSQIEAVFFDCDGTLVDSEVICSRAYVSMFQAFGITLDLEEIFKRFKGVKLYEIIDIINEEHGVELAKADLEPVYRAEVARLFDTELEVIAGANTLLDSMAVPMCVVSNGPVSKMQHSLGTAITDSVSRSVKHNSGHDYKQLASTLLNFPTPCFRFRYPMKSRF